jgi:hypothetical protein
MVIEDLFLVLEDGCVMNTNTGMIQWPSRNKRGQKYFILDGKFYLQRNLIKMRKENGRL